jgi:stearoyl-CoA desaturase (Delta-9 desaturase)
MSFANLFLNPQVKAHLQKHGLQFDWVNTLFVMSFMVFGLIGVPLYYFTGHAMHPGPWILAVVGYWIPGIGITMGYHRLFSHKTYEAARWVEGSLLAVGAVALQNSALKWSADHRRHHSFTDTEKDPYNAKFGFLWSHILWIFFSDPKEKAQRFSGETAEQRLLQEFPQCRDLVRNPLVRLQHRFAIPFGFLVGFGLPIAIGMSQGLVWEYLLVGGFLRATILHNSTFFINSLAHIWGGQPHSDEDTSRDSAAMAVLALGEGYHNYHHTYPNDYRNGTRAYHFDPTKWLIYGLSKVGSTWNLKRSRPSTVKHQLDLEPLQNVINLEDGPGSSPLPSKDLPDSRNRISV